MVLEGVCYGKIFQLSWICSLHDFLAVKNPSQPAVMKIRDLVYAGPLDNMPIKLTGDYSPTTRVFPAIYGTFAANGLVKKLTGVKYDHIKQLYANFIQRDQWHELVTNA